MSSNTPVPDTQSASRDSSVENDIGPLPVVISHPAPANVMEALRQHIQGAEHADTLAPRPPATSRQPSPGPEDNISAFSCNWYNGVVNVSLIDSTAFRSFGLGQCDRCATEWEAMLNHHDTFECFKCKKNLPTKDNLMYCTAVDEEKNMVKPMCGVCGDWQGYVDVVKESHPPASQRGGDGIMIRRGAIRPVD